MLFVRLTDQRGRALGRMETIRNREQHHAKDCEMVGGSKKKIVHSLKFIKIIFLTVYLILLTVFIKIIFLKTVKCATKI